MSALPIDASPTAGLLAPNFEFGPQDEIDYDSLVTEDNKPVERIFIEKLYRLLTRPLYASWKSPGEGQPYVVLVNVGWFYQRSTPAVVPDCLLSLGVTCPNNLQVKEGHSYYQWDMGKPPDVVIEAVSDRTGGEESFKKNLYARLGLPYYAVYDPKHLLSNDTLRTYELRGRKYRAVDAGPWEDVGLGLRLWPGIFEGVEETWLRWCDANGEIIPTGEERAARLAEEVRRANESTRLANESSRLAEERARLADERNRELEEELRRLKGELPSS